jgi:hypothetical protein
MTETIGRISRRNLQRFVYYEQQGNFFQGIQFSMQKKTAAKEERAASAKPSEPKGRKLSKEERKAPWLMNNEQQPHPTPTT